jgi:type IV pilus assembly protein PilM
VGDSIWKKEISFGKKSKEPKEPKAPKAPKEPKAESTSFWKKEVSFGRKKEPVADDAPRELKEEKPSIWRREVGLPGKKKEEEQVARLVELATRTVDPTFAPSAEPAPAEPVTPPTEIAEAVVAAAPPADAPTPLAEVHPVEQLPVDLPVEPAAPVAPLAAVPDLPAEEPDDFHLEAGPVEDWMEPQALESWLAEAELPPDPEADTAVVLHPPVPASELPELPAAKVPFWKKELGGKAKTPKAPKEPKAPKGDQKPFWKRELSFARRPDEQPETAVEQVEPVEPKVPFWKKQIGGKPKPAKEYTEPRAKRSFSLPELSLPSLSRGGGHQVKRLVGLKVGGSQLAAARVANNGAAELLQVARVDLAPGVVVSGELRDPDSLANALRDFFAKNKLPRKNVRLGIASNRIGVRTFEITGIDDPKQLENAIHFRAQEALPIPLDEAVLDYHVLEERADEEGTTTKRVLLVVAYRELVDRYVDACKKAGIVLSGIDLEAFALLRAMSAPRPETEAGDSALVAVAIGHDRSTFAVSDGRVCDFTRVLEWGGSALNVAIARALDLAPSEAESIKRAVSLSSPDVPNGIAYEQYSLAVDAVRKQVHTFARELVSSLQFYQNQPGSLGIGEIVITGGTANLAGIAEELQRLIGVQVRVGDPLARLKITKKLSLDEPMGSLAVAIGLGIED